MSIGIQPDMYKLIFDDMHTGGFVERSEGIGGQQTA